MRADGRRARRSVVALGAALTAAMLAGCSPTYDWREIVDAGAGVRMLMPGRPSELTRPVRLGELPVSMTMRGARVEGTTFAVGSVTLPDDDAATREQAVAAMRAALVRNIGGHETASTTIDIAVLDDAGRETARQPAQAIEAEGRIGDARAHLHARFAARGRRAWQWVVVGPAPDAGQAATFLESVRVVD